jgi:hypothetical protein
LHITDQKEAYQYKDYLPGWQGAKITPVAGMPYLFYPQTPQSVHHRMVNEYKNVASDGPIDFSDLFRHKRDLADSNIGMILMDIQVRDSLLHDNLTRLYDDLLQVDNWRNARPYAQQYVTDKLWHDMNRMELDIRDKIRRELNTHAKDTVFATKDLRESVLDYNRKSRKSAMLGGLEASFTGDGDTGPDGLYGLRGDRYFHP